MKFASRPKAAVGLNVVVPPAVICGNTFWFWANTVVSTPSSGLLSRVSGGNLYIWILALEFLAVRPVSEVKVVAATYRAIGIMLTGFDESDRTKYGAMTSSPTGAREVAWNTSVMPVFVLKPNVFMRSVSVGSVLPAVPFAFTPRSD